MEKELKTYMSNVDEVITLLKKKVERLEGEKQAAEEKAALYEKALKEIHGIVCSDIPNDQEVGAVSASRCIEIDEYITDALTPKTSEDEKP